MKSSEHPHRRNAAATNRACAGGAGRHGREDGRELVRRPVASPVGTAPGAAGRRVHAVASDRSRSRLRVSSRETCIWLTPTRSAISDWVMLSKKRSSTMRRSRAGQRFQQLVELGPVLDPLELGVVVTEARGELATLVVRRHRPVERDEAVQRPGFHRLEHGLFGHPGPLRDLGRRRRPPVLLAECRHDPAELEVQLLHAARHADGPATIAEVPLQLAEDRRGGERRELQAPIRVEALDGLEQADQGDLDEVVALLAAIGEAARRGSAPAGRAPRRARPAGDGRPCGGSERSVRRGAARSRSDATRSRRAPAGRSCSPADALPRGLFADVHHQRGPRITSVNRMLDDPSTISTSSDTASTMSCEMRRQVQRSQRALSRARRPRPGRARARRRIQR